MKLSALFTVSLALLSVTYGQQPMDPNGVLLKPIPDKPTVFVTEKNAAEVTESGKPTGKVEGVKFLRMEGSAAVYTVGSGIYRFQSTLPETIK